MIIPHVDSSKISMIIHCNIHFFIQWILYHFLFCKLWMNIHIVGNNSKLEFLMLAVMMRSHQINVALPLRTSWYWSSSASPIMRLRKVMINSEKTRHQVQEWSTTMEERWCIRHVFCILYLAFESIGTDAAEWWTPAFECCIDATLCSTLHLPQDNSERHGRPSKWTRSLTWCASARRQRTPIVHKVLNMLFPLLSM
jgi:hypothetical protein